MTNNRQKPTHPEKTKVKKLPRLKPLKLQQLDGIVGGGHFTFTSFKEAADENTFSVLNRIL